MVIYLLTLMKGKTEHGRRFKERFLTCPHVGGLGKWIKSGSLTPWYLTLLQSGTEERGLRHYWFTSWPDQKTPDRAPPLLQLVLEVEEAAGWEGQSFAPIIVHCR